MTLNLLQHEHSPVSLRRNFNLVDRQDDFLASHPRFDWATELR
jgi:hypothetical protein